MNSQCYSSGLFTISDRTSGEWFVATKMTSAMVQLNFKTANTPDWRLDNLCWSILELLTYSPSEKDFPLGWLLTDFLWKLWSTEYRNRKITGFMMINPGNTKGVNLTPLVFSNFLQNPLEFSEKQLVILRGFHFWSVDGRVNVGGRSYLTQSYEDNTKSPIQHFHRFRYKYLLKFIFWNNFS